MSWSMFPGLSSTCLVEDRAISVLAPGHLALSSTKHVEDRPGNIIISSDKSTGYFIFHFWPSETKAKQQ